ncbi:MAG: aminotransferase class V-fold PLP-dependent enzyme [Oscillospiraceae bacterium]|nr:aminotransferase class V-fold PLP-dependent enzyme [Oscillospiraceae bacterium]
MIYFDNAATTYPKPESVRRAAAEAIVRYGGNPGRSGHKMSMDTAQAVYSVREKAGEMFGAPPENVIFTANCTESLNMAIKGLAERDLREGRPFHVIISSLEHNSVFRPVYELTKRGLTYSIADVTADDSVTVHNFESLVTPVTKAVICTLGSNVTGQLLPYERIGALCRRKNICFVGDGAQVCGVIPIDLKRDNINILCMPGHKGLYGISGTGMLITDGKYPIYHILEGGTGSTSLDAEQTPFLPEGLESGTVNTVGIVTVGAGIDFIRRVGAERIHSRETELCRRFINALENESRVRIYRRERCSYLPIVLFNVEGFSPEETAAYLSDRGFALRGGLHCSGLAHRSAGTLPEGGVRFSPSVFNTAAQTDMLADAVKKLAHST